MKNYGFLSLALRQRLIKRWSLMYCTHEENVLEHSAVVTLLSLLAGHIAHSIGRNVNIERMMGHAICHDLAEILSQDVVQTVKTATPALHSEFKKLEKVCELKLLDTLPDDIRDSIESHFTLSGYEKDLVKACDMYAAYIKCRQEVDAGNHIEFKDALNKMKLVVEDLCRDYPEIEILHNSFNKGLSQSVDELLN